MKNKIELSDLDKTDPARSELLIVGAAEQTLVKNGALKYIFSIDEVGRGCIAGSVVSGCTSWMIVGGESINGIEEKTLSHARLLLKAKDSKKMSEKKRREIFDLSLMEAISNPEMKINESPKDYIKSQSSLPEFEEKTFIENSKSSILHYSSGDSFLTIPTAKSSFDRVGYVSDKLEIPSGASIEVDQTILNSSLLFLSFKIASASAVEIGRLGILRATNLSMARALLDAMLSVSVMTGVTLEEVRSASLVIVDGDIGMAFPKEVSPRVQATVVQGDNRLKTIGLSSIMAKVARDDLMISLSKIYQGYGFEKHKGYGTKEHYEAIRCLGEIPEIHGRGFRLT